jgi:molybdopterin molybdotransferase
MKLTDDCFVHDKDRLRHDEALDILSNRMQTIAQEETITLENARGRIIASDVTAPRNIPAFNNSAVDGFAFSHADFEPTGGFFPLMARIAAGEQETIELPGFSAARIFTGAKMPQGADTVAMQEDCEMHEQNGTNYVVIPSGLKKGANCRLAGEDVSLNDIVVKAGTKLRPQDLAAIASTGTDKIKAYKPLKVGLLSSGDELLLPGETFVDGMVYDANHPMLGSLMKSSGIEVHDLGLFPDKASEVESRLQQAASHYDVIISSGGASKGEEDHFVDAMGNLGKCHLWQLAVKPGRPMSFGQINDTLIFTLPGNPVAAFVCYVLYVRPSLERLGGGKFKTPQRYKIPSAFEIKSKPDRREFLRGFLIRTNAKTSVQKFDRDGSGLITGLREATGLIEIPEETTSVSIGDDVDYIPFAEFGIGV